jgi:hypothetical protein
VKRFKNPVPIVVASELSVAFLVVNMIKGLFIRSIFEVFSLPLAQLPQTPDSRSFRFVSYSNPVPNVTVTHFPTGIVSCIK